MAENSTPRVPVPVENEFPPEAADSEGARDLAACMVAIETARQLTRTFVRRHLVDRCPCGFCGWAGGNGPEDSFDTHDVYELMVGFKRMAEYTIGYLSGVIPHLVHPMPKDTQAGWPPRRFCEPAGRGR